MTNDKLDELISVFSKIYESKMTKKDLQRVISNHLNSIKKGLYEGLCDRKEYVVPLGSLTLYFEPNKNDISFGFLLNANSAAHTLLVESGILGHLSDEAKKKLQELSEKIINHARNKIIDKNKVSEMLF